MIKQTTMASILRKPILVNNNKIRTSKTVMKTAIINGIPKSKYNAMAAPITSAMSVAMMANSVKIHKTMPSRLLVRARIAWAKSI